MNWVCVYTHNTHISILYHKPPVSIKPKDYLIFPKWAAEKEKKNVREDNTLNFSPEFSSIWRWCDGLISLAQVTINSLFDALYIQWSTFSKTISMSNIIVIILFPTNISENRTTFYQCQNNQRMLSITNT